MTELTAETIRLEQRKQLYDFIYDIVLEHDIEIRGERMPEEPEISNIFYQDWLCFLVAVRKARKYVITCRRTKNPAVIKPEKEEILYSLQWDSRALSESTFLRYSFCSGRKMKGVGQHVSERVLKPVPGFSF